MRISPLLLGLVILCVVAIPGCDVPDPGYQDGLTEAQREAKYQDALAKMRVIAERHERESEQKRLNHVSSGCMATLILGGARQTCRVLALDNQVSPPLWRIRLDDGRISEALSSELTLLVEQQGR